MADFLQTHIQDGSRLSVVSAYFTIYAYHAMRDTLDRIEHLDFLFGEPSFINRLDPDKTQKKAFLIKDDGTVRFSFAQPKESLLLLRDLAAGETSAFEKLCDLFDSRTGDGSDMSHYSGLLGKVLASIEHTFQRRAASSLLAGRGAILPTASEVPASDGDDFDLVTWLVICPS